MRFHRQRLYIALLSLFVALSGVSSGLDTLSGQCVNGQCSRFPGSNMRRSASNSITTRRYVKRVPTKTRMTTPHRSQPGALPATHFRSQNTSTTSSLSLATLALAGFSPVSLLDQTQWVVGKNDYTLDYQGKRFWFSNAQQRRTFLQSPDRYTPVAMGRCLVTWADHGRERAGQVQYTAIYRQRIYLFRDHAAKQRFLERPEYYHNWLEQSQQTANRPERRASR